MGGLEHSTPGITLCLILVASLLVYFINKAKKNGDVLYVRRIPGVDAVEEATGRAAELGRPISFCFGLTPLSPVIYACLGVLTHVAKRAALLKSRLLLPQTQPEVMALVEDTVRTAYRDAGKSSRFDPQDIIYLSDEQFAFASGYMGLIHREKVGSAFLFGAFNAESLLLSSAGQQIGAMQVAATVSPEQAAFFLCTCDYTLIGEELFAASAYLSREPIQMGSLIAQDWMKLFFLIFMLAGVFVATWSALRGVPLRENMEILFSYSWGELF